MKNMIRFVLLLGTMSYSFRQYDYYLLNISVFQKMSFSILLMLFYVILLSSNCFGQLKKFTAPSLISETTIMIDEKSKVRYSDLITIKFNIKMIDLQDEHSRIKLDNINSAEVKELFIKIRKKYGKFEIVKLIPKDVSPDTIVINKRSGKKISIPDWSQVFKLKFKNLVPIDSLIIKLNKLPTIEYAEEPFYAYSATEANYDLFNKNNNWAFEKIMAKDAWNISKGDSSVIIGIHDIFGFRNLNEIHEDLKGKVDSHFGAFGNHGISVAGIAGANTNNEIGIVSLGWNLHLQFYNLTNSAPEILRAINDGVDVINFSWVRRVDLPSLRDAVKTALAHGVICVAAAGNNQTEIPDTLYPAAYNFGEIGQVIAVSSTKLVDNKEIAIDGWNYSPGNNPITDPTSSFIDISAPGANIFMLDGNSNSGYLNGSGTSLSTPFVSALVGLMLSIDSSLTPNEVYYIITETADKVGQYEYNKYGWNKHLGYGRINAYKALNSVARLVNTHQTSNLTIPMNFMLEQNYPNPFNPFTTINYSLLKRSYITLKIFDVLGKEVLELVNREQAKGNYKVEVDATLLSSGVYLYSLQTNDIVETKKMILTK